MEHRVTAEEDGRAVRDVLRNVLRVSTSGLRSAKWNGGILVNGAPVSVRTVLHTGDMLSFQPREKAPAFTPAPYPLPLTIPWQDNSLLVVDKPAPLAVQCSARQPDDTLENALYSWLGCPEDFVFRPVNRLDKGTSGLMTVARDAHTQQLLQRALHSDSFRRVYLAVTEGCPPQESGVIDLPIAKAASATVRREVSGQGRPSRTHYTVLRRSGGRALVRLCLETGRTHQIRVHLSALGCPVCGDFLYGTELPELPGRFALHAAELHLIHPCTGEAIDLSSPLPEALCRLLD